MFYHVVIVGCKKKQMRTTYGICDVHFSASTRSYDIVYSSFKSLLQVLPTIDTQSIVHGMVCLLGRTIQPNWTLKSYLIHVFMFLIFFYFLTVIFFPSCDTILNISLQFCIDWAVCGRCCCNRRDVISV